jgi:hypothetical protein
MKLILMAYKNSKSNEKIELELKKLKSLLCKIKIAYNNLFNRKIFFAVFLPEIHANNTA